MKSKEEILNNTLSEISPFLSDDDKVDCILKAMDEYAQEMSVGFAEWTQVNLWVLNHGGI